MATLDVLDAPPRPAYLALADAARLCPSLRSGKPTHPATLTRWILRGVRLRGGTLLKLAAKRFPGGWAVSKEALDEFIDAITRDRCGDPAAPAADEPRPPASRRRAIDAAERELERAGV